MLILAALFAAIFYSHYRKAAAKAAAVAAKDKMSTPAPSAPTSSPAPVGKPVRKPASASFAGTYRRIRVLLCGEKALLVHFLRYSGTDAGRIIGRRTVAVRWANSVTCHAVDGLAHHQFRMVLADGKFVTLPVTGATGDKWVSYDGFISNSWDTEVRVKRGLLEVLGFGCKPEPAQPVRRAPVVAADDGIIMAPAEAAPAEAAPAAVPVTTDAAPEVAATLRDVQRIRLAAVQPHVTVSGPAPKLRSPSRYDTVSVLDSFKFQSEIKALAEKANLAALAKGRLAELAETRSKLRPMGL